MSDDFHQPIINDWYYADGNQRQGPVNDDDLATLVVEGRVTDDTLVWRKGFEGWMPYREAMAMGPPIEGVVCSLCGRQTAEDNYILIENRIVCADCKPQYVQMLREGVATQGTMRYAGFWIRFLAKLIDSIILMVVGMLSSIPMMFIAMNDEENYVMFFLTYMITTLLQFAVGAGYVTWFVGRFGATPGKMACRLRVVMPDGSPVSYWRAFGRYFGEMLSGFTIYIGYIIVAFDEQKRALHDHICSTRVVYTE